MLLGSINNPSLVKRCDNEVFTIHKYHGSGTITDGSRVYLKRKWCGSDRYVTGKSGDFVQITDYLGSCERWTIRKA